jgi:hypothetical protein
VSDSVDEDVHLSEPAFRTIHALRIRGFAKAEVVAEIADVDLDEALTYLGDLQERDLAMFREVRALWQLTAAGREAHARLLADDVVATTTDGRLGPLYAQFLRLNEELNELCGEWQLRDGQPNVVEPRADRGRALDDRAIAGRLAALNDRAVPLVEALAQVLPRLLPYAGRLAHSCQRFLGGETNMFTGVMCGSYHDVWMELHEDLILTQGIDRADEGVS